MSLLVKEAHQIFHELNDLYQLKLESSNLNSESQFLDIKKKIRSLNTW